MSDHRWQCALVTGEPFKNPWNAVAAGLNYEHGPPETWNTFCIPLCFKFTTDPVTHFGARFPATDSFKTMLDDAALGTFPEIEGVTEAELVALVNQLDFRIAIVDEFFELVDSLDLQLWQAPAP